MDPQEEVDRLMAIQRTATEIARVITKAGDMKTAMGALGVVTGSLAAISPDSDEFLKAVNDAAIIMIHAKRRTPRA